MMGSQICLLTNPVSICYDYHVMLERASGFHDEKIYAWAQQLGEKFGELGKDPTILVLDVQKEDLYETRIYCFRPGLAPLAHLTNFVVSRRCDLRLSLKQAMEAAMELAENAGFEFLAKRRKEDGLVTFLFVGVAPGSRILLSSEESVEEAKYRQAVESFESGSLYLQGVLTAPLVITADKWRRYDQEGLFLREQSAGIGGGKT